MSNEQFLLQTLGRGPGGRDIVSRVCGSDPIVAAYYILHAGFLTCVFLLSHHRTTLTFTNFVTDICHRV